MNSYFNLNKLIVQIDNKSIRQTMAIGIKLFIMYSWLAWAIALPIIILELIK